MKKVAIKIYDDSNNTITHELINNSNHPTIITATTTSYYELINQDRDVAPDHIITKRDGNNLVVIFDNSKDFSDLIIEDFYRFKNSSLVGIAESGHYYYYTPDTGEVSDYVTLLEPSKGISGHALGGVPIDNPWWASSDTIDSETDSENITATDTSTDIATASDVTTPHSEVINNHSSITTTDMTVESRPVSTDNGFIHSVGQWKYLPWVFVGSLFTVAAYAAMDNDNDNDSKATDTTTDTNNKPNNSASIPSITINAITGDNVLDITDVANSTTTITGTIANIRSTAQSVNVDVTVNDTLYPATVDGQNYSVDIPTSILQASTSVTAQAIVTQTDGSTVRSDINADGSSQAYTVADNAIINVTVPNGETLAMGNTLDNTMQGNNLDNTLNGKEGNDTLIGGGGSDTLIGGSGSDTFKFSDALDGSIDTISDFTVGEDKLQLDRSVFTELNTDKSNLMAHINYDDSTGKLSYDSDGAGPLSAVHFATLSTGLSLSEDSFSVI